MQSWICAYCRKLYLNPEALIDHLYNEHQEDMADVDKLTALTLLLIVANLEREVMPMEQN